MAGRRRLPPDKRGPTTGHYGNSNSDNDNDDDNDNDNNHSSTPLLSQLEREFLFGAGAAKRVAADRSTAGADQDEVCNAPSMRKTTLGRLLRRSASSSLPTTTSTAPHHASPLSESSSVSSLFRRPLSAGGNGGPRADDHATGRRRRKPGRSVCFNNNRPSSSRGENAAVFGKARIRPASASAGSGRRRRGSPPFSAAAAAAGDLPCTQPDGVHRHPDRGRLSSSPYNRDNNNVRAGGAASAARSLASPGAAAATRARERETGLSEGTAAAAATGRVTRKPSLNIHQALEATIKAAIGVVSPREQFVNARRTIAEMKKINTKDSTGDMLLTTQVSQSQSAFNMTSNVVCVQVEGA